MRLCFLLWLAAAAGFLTACNERAGAPIAPTGRTGGGAGEEDAGKKQDATVAMPEPEEDAGAEDAGADAGPTPSCAVDNGGCGDAMYWACSDTGGSIECADINECDTDNGGCGDATYWVCTNNEGAAPTCADINECDTNNGGCGDATYWTCTNNEGAAPTCADINECDTDNGGCGDATYWTCTNNEGAAPTCADINECDTDNGGCGDATYWTCTNNEGAAPTCADINECDANNGGCGDATYWVCTNNEGAAPTCADINECDTNNGGCGDATYWACINNEGGAPTCKDVNECEGKGGKKGDERQSPCGKLKCINNEGADPTCEETCLDHGTEDACLENRCVWLNDACTSPCEYLPESFCDRPQCEWTDEFHPLCETKCSYFTDFGSCSVNYQCLWDGSTCGDACSYRYDEQVCTSSSLCAWNEDWEYCDDECAAHSDRAICNAVSACMWSGLQGGCSKGCYSLDTEQCAAEPICNIDSYGFCVPGCLYGEGTSQTCGFNEGCAWDVGNQACTPDCGAETDEASCEAIAHCAWGTAAGDTVPSCGVALHMFLLPISVGGKIGGISGADALCEGAEAHPGVGTYKALLVDGNARVACQSADCGLGGASEGVDWVLKPSMRYVVEGESGTVMTETDENAIFVLPLEAPLADSGFLWSGVNQNWTSGVSCSGWTNDALGGGDAYWGSAGSLSSTHIGVLSNGSYGCNPTTPMHILCVEQLP